MRPSVHRRRRVGKGSWVVFALMGLGVGGLGMVFASAGQAAETPQRSLEDLLQAAEEKPSPAERRPLPDQAEVQKAQKMLDEVYKQDMTAAKTPEKKAALAGRLLAEGLEAHIPAEQFVLLQSARHWAVQAGDTALALRAVDALAERFQVDALALKTEVLEALSRSIPPVLPLELAENAESLAEQAVQQEKYELALRLNRLSLQMARRTKNTELIKRLTNRSREIEQAAKAYQKVQAAQESLRQNPQDAQAHLVVGRYLCFVKGQWDQGLSHLAQGADETLRPLAQQDLAGPTDSAKQLALAEGWWARADQEEDPTVKAHIQARAAHWYQAALPSLTGLDKIKAERRIQEAAQAKGPSSEPPSPTHYLDPANRKNILVLRLLDGWKPDGAQFLRIEKVKEDGYRLQAHPEIDWVVMAFPQVPPSVRRLRMAYTIEKGEARVHIRNFKLTTAPPYIFLPSEGRHVVEAWLENNRFLGLLDDKPVQVYRDNPQHYGWLDISLRGGASIIVHELQFLPIKKEK